MKHRWFIGGIALALVAGQASAAVIKVTEKGVVTTGIDGSGLFGQAGADLTNDEYVASILVDTSKGYYQSGVHYYNQIPTGDFIVYGRTSGVFNDENEHSIGITGSVEINGQKQDIDGSISGRDYWDFDSYHIGFNSLYTDVSGQGGILSFALGGYAIPQNLVFGSGVDPVLNPQSFSNDYDPQIGYESLWSSYSNKGTSAQLYATSYSYDVLDPTGGPTVFTSAAPEPGVWALMIAGLGLIGAALRFSRRHQGLVTA